MAMTAWSAANEVARVLGYGDYYQLIGVEEFGGDVYVDYVENGNVFAEPRNGRTVVRFGTGEEALNSAYAWLQCRIADGDRFAGGAFSLFAMSAIIARLNENPS